MNPFCPLCRMDCPDQHLIPNRNLEYILENYRELCSSDNDKDYKVVVLLKNEVSLEMYDFRKDKIMPQFCQ